MNTSIGIIVSMFWNNFRCLLKCLAYRNGKKRQGKRNKRNFWKRIGFELMEECHILAMDMALIPSPRAKSQVVVKRIPGDVRTFVGASSRLSCTCAVRFCSFSLSWNCRPCFRYHHVPPPHAHGVPRHGPATSHSTSAHQCPSPSPRCHSPAPLRPS
jgi:hypothetical protein